MGQRQTWDEYFLSIAQTVSTRATCPRARCGAVLVQYRRILTTGYNGASPGMPHCDDVGCLMEEGHCQRSIHAETNAVGQAASMGIAVAGATLYLHRDNVTSDTGNSVCRECLKLLHATRILDITTAHENTSLRSLRKLSDKITLG